MAAPLLAALTLVAVATTRAAANDADLPECANYGTQIRTDLDEKRVTANEECPQNAVCADKWNTIRDWYNGTRCRDLRYMVHCTCPGGNACPITSPSHELADNNKHTMYTCEAKCSLEACRTMARSAYDKVVASSEFNGRPFYRMNCRCHGHHYPPTSGGRNGLQKATKYMRIWFNRNAGDRSTSILNRCSELLENGDPCRA